MRLHRVNERLYRSNQPTLGELAELKALGIQTIINLRREKRAFSRAEQKACRELGIRFFHFPFYGIFGAKEAFVTAILQEIQNPSNGVVLVHCEGGKDRTSLVIGLYHVICENMPIDKVWKEDFVAFGHDPDDPEIAWAHPIANYFYLNVRRTFLAYAKRHPPR